VKPIKIPQKYSLALLVSLQLLTFNIKLLHASFEEKPVSARAAGMGEAMAAVSGDANSFFYNPAGFRFSQHKELLTNYTRLFDVPDLPYQNFAVGLPTQKYGAWGLAYGQFGPSEYREQEFLLSHSVLLSPAAAFGYSIRREGLKLKRYGSTAAWGLDLGVVGQLHPKVKGGFAVKNLNHPNYGSSSEGPSQEMRAGVAFKALPGFLTSFDAVKPAEGALSYRGGEEIQISRVLALRFGVETAPNRFSGGLGLRFKIFHLDYAFLTHPFLHDQQHVTLSLWWGGEEELQVAEAAPKARRAKKKALPKKLMEGSAQKVDINAASAEELQALPGIGGTMAERIVEYRQQKGRFQRDTDLLNVPQFQRRIFIRVRPYLIVGPGDGKSAVPVPEPSPAVVPPPAPEPAPVEEEMPEEEPEQPAEEEEKPAPAAVPAPVPAPASPPVLPSSPPAPEPVPSPAVPVEPAPPAEEVPASEPETRAAPTGGLDVNSASAAQLERIGFSSVQAKNIVRYRQRKGSFSSVNDLRNVPGVSGRTLDAVRGRLSAE